jgi:hypothetical protein
MDSDTKKSPTIGIVLAWLLVAVPLGWGVYNTLLNSLSMFDGR